MNRLCQALFHRIGTFHNKKYRLSSILIRIKESLTLRKSDVRDIFSEINAEESPKGFSILLLTFDLFVKTAALQNQQKTGGKIIPGTDLSFLFNRSILGL